MIHAVPWGSSTLTAECGQRLGVGDHTGHYRPLHAFDDELCPACEPVPDEAAS